MAVEAELRIGVAPFFGPPLDQKLVNGVFLASSKIFKFSPLPPCRNGGTVGMEEGVSGESP